MSKYNPNNRKFAETDSYFKDCCKAVEITPTARQAGRWRNQSGIAYNEGRRIVDKGVKE